MASFVYAAQSALGMSLAATSAAKTAIEKSDKATSAAEDAKAALCIFGGRIRTKNEKKRIFNKLRFF